MDKSFQLNVRAFFSNFGELIKRHFAAKHAQAGALILPEFDRLPGTDIGLGRYVEIQFGCPFLDEHENARIGDNQAIRLNFAYRIDIVGQFVDILVVGKQIESEIDAFAIFMGELYALNDFFQREFRLSAERQIGRAEINRIRAIEHGDFQLLANLPVAAVRNIFEYQSSYIPINHLGRDIPKLAAFVHSIVRMVKSRIGLVNHPPGAIVLPAGGAFDDFFTAINGNFVLIFAAILA